MELKGVLEPPGISYSSGATVTKYLSKQLKGGRPHFGSWCESAVHYGVAGKATWQECEAVGARCKLSQGA